MSSQTYPKNDKGLGLFHLSIITRRISIPVIRINYNGQTIQETIQEYISKTYEGNCQVEGYIRPGTCTIVNISGGAIDGASVIFNVMFSCYICNPVEGMTLSCIVKAYTGSGGIRAHICNSEEDASHQNAILVIFITTPPPDAAKCKDGTILNNVRVVGSRFELNDTFISVIGEIV
jgi:hypothetical protein